MLFRLSIEAHFNLQFINKNKSMYGKIPLENILKKLHFGIQITTMNVRKFVIKRMETKNGKSLSSHINKVRKLEARREEIKVLSNKRLERIDENRLVKIVVEKVRENRGIWWWEEYEVLRRKFELDNKVQLVSR